jgi:hypothetical protein
MKKETKFLIALAALGTVIYLLSRKKTVIVETKDNVPAASASMMQIGRPLVVVNQPETPIVTTPAAPASNFPALTQNIPTPTPNVEVPTNNNPTGGIRVAPTTEPIVLGSVMADPLAGTKGFI